MNYLYQNKYWKINKEYNLDKLLYLMIDRPIKIIDCNVNFIWKTSKEQWHRDYDLPSNVYCYYDNNNKETCNLFWRIKDRLHRNNNKPSFIRDDGYKQYHTNGKFIKEEQIQ